MKHKILIVDDDENIIESYKRNLKKNFNIDYATTGAEGLEAIKKKNYAVVVSDYKMPLMDGIAFLKKIKEIAPHTLRILITGHPDIDMALRAVNEGEIFKFLIKPYPIPDFSITLRMALGKYKLELERKNREQQNEFLSLHDSLTTLPNRVFMLNKLTQAIALAKRNNKKVGIIFIDLDRFKNVNDTMGHDVGDLLLVKVAQILKGSVREIDTVSRLGGDEFVIIMQNLHNEKETSILAKRIIELFNKPLIVDDKNCDVGLSMGISFYPKHGGNPENLLKIADDAMYTAKKIKGNSFNTAKS